MRATSSRGGMKSEKQRLPANKPISGLTRCTILFSYISALLRSETSISFSSQKHSPLCKARRWRTTDGDRRIQRASEIPRHGTLESFTGSESATRKCGFVLTAWHSEISRNSFHDGSLRARTICSTTLLVDWVIEQKCTKNRARPHARLFRVATKFTQIP